MKRRPGEPEEFEVWSLLAINKHLNSGVSSFLQSDGLAID
jgi:hypothetical protein